jgi:predicted Zn-dependent peptidase
MRFAYKHINSPVAYCALTIGAGTRDEDPDVNGVAHFTEHMIFKGTNHKVRYRSTTFSKDVEES